MGIYIHTCAHIHMVRGKYVKHNEEWQALPSSAHITKSDNVKKSTLYDLKLCENL